MSLTTFQKARRAGRVTASNVPAILGVDPWKSPRAAFMEITGRSAFEGNEATRVGNDLEPYVLCRFSEETGKRLTRRGINRGTVDSLILCTLDAVVVDEPAAVEAKSSGIINPWGKAKDEWGETGSDQIPERHLFQIAGQFIAAPDLETIYPAALVAGLGFRWYVVSRASMEAARMLDLVAQGVERFSTDFLAKDQPPPPDWRDLGVIEKYEREAGLVADVPPDLFGALLTAKDRTAECEKIEAEARARLLEAMKVGEDYADEGRCAHGTVTYRRTKDSAGFDLSRLRDEQPDVAAKYTTTKAGYRRLVLKPAKEG